jgi:tryptophan synthase alpha chain
MQLLEALNERKKRRNILLMTHIVVGYPNLEQSLLLVDAMVHAGVDLMELQIPFSEPMADGPVILHANQAALKGGIVTGSSTEFGGELEQYLGRCRLATELPSRWASA